MEDSKPYFSYGVDFETCSDLPKLLLLGATGYVGFLFKKPA